MRLCVKDEVALSRVLWGVIRAHNLACATLALGDPVGFEPVSPFLSVTKRDAFYEHNVGQFDLGFVASFIREPVSTVQEIIC